jgi:hypothetical protein
MNEREIKIYDYKERKDFKKKKEHKIYMIEEIINRKE